MTMRVKDAWFVTLLTLAGLAGPGLARQAQAGCMDGATSGCIIDGQGGRRTCDGGVWGLCEPLPPPESPVLVAPRFTARTANRISLEWSATTPPGEVHQLQLQVGNAWTPLATLVSPATFAHTGLQPDTKYCYRVQATGGPYGSRTSVTRCQYTTDGTNRRAARLQIQLHTANVGDAGTDNDIRVELSDAVSGAGLNQTWLDYGQDDFERGQTFTYDLNLDYIHFVSDISKVRIMKTGTNGWCLADFALLVNGNDVFTESFAALPGGCLWLDNDPGFPSAHEVDHARLRAHPEWQSYQEPARLGIDGTYPNLTAILTIPRAETEQRLEGLIGHLIQGTAAHWGDKHGRAYLEADPGSYANRLAVDLDLEGTLDNWFDPEIDIDFELDFQARCSDDQKQAIVEVKTEDLNASVDFDWFIDFLGFVLPCGPVATPIADEPIPDCVTYLEDYIAEKIEGAIRPVVQSERQALPEQFRCLGAEVVVHRDPTKQAYGDVDLVFQLEAQEPPPLPAPSPSNFSITCTPASLTIPNVGSGTSFCTVTSRNGFTGPVSLGCTGLPSGATCSFSPATVTPPANGSVTSNLNLFVGTTPAGAYGFRAQAMAGALSRREANLTLMVVDVPTLVATFDPARQAPSCGAKAGGACDTGASLIRSRGVAGGEPNGPNAIGGACLDGEADSGREGWNAIERIKVFTLDGGDFVAGQAVRIDATVRAVTRPEAQAVDFFYATDADDPVWTPIGTVATRGSGAQTVSMAYRIPKGGWHAVRVQFGERSDGSACAPGEYHDRDDLVFSVADIQE